MEQADINFVEKALDDLIDSFGVQEPVKYYKITKLIRSEKYHEAVHKVASELGLPITVNIEFVSSTQGFDGHHSSTSKRNNQNKSTPARVLIPSDLPFYGSSEMTGFPIEVQIKKGRAQKPTSMVAVLAHELSHIVLHSMHHQRKDSEAYTDLTAMILGFDEVMEKGREDFARYFNDPKTNKRKKQKIKYGYLDDSTFEHALNKIRRTREKRKQKKESVIKIIDEIKEIANGIPAKIDVLRNRLDGLRDKQRENISQEKAKQLQHLHLPDYGDDKKAYAKKAKEEAKEKQEKIENISTYNDKSMKAISDLKNHSERLRDNLESRIKSIENDIRLAESCYSFMPWLKLQIRKFI